MSVLDVIVHSCGRDKAGRTERQRASAIFSLKASTVKALTLNARLYTHKIGLTHKPAALFLYVCVSALLELVWNYKASTALVYIKSK